MENSSKKENFLIDILYNELLDEYNNIKKPETERSKNKDILKVKSLINKLFDKKLKEQSCQLTNNLVYLEQTNRNYIKMNFLKQTKIDILENEIDYYMEMEEEFEEMKEKFKYEEGNFLNNEKKENEILILRAENSNLRKIIDKNERTIEQKDQIIEKYKNSNNNNNYSPEEEKNVAYNNSNINTIKKRLLVNNSRTNTNNNTNNNSLVVHRINSPLSKNNTSRQNGGRLSKNTLKNVRNNCNMLNMKKLKKSDNFNKSLGILSNSLLNTNNTSKPTKNEGGDILTYRNNINSYMKNITNGLSSMTRTSSKLKSTSNLNGQKNNAFNNKALFSNHFDIINNNPTKITVKQSQCKKNSKKVKEDLLYARYKNCIIKSPSITGGEHTKIINNTNIINNIMNNFSMPITSSSSRSKEKTNQVEHTAREHKRDLKNKSANHSSFNIKQMKGKY